MKLLLILIVRKVIKLCVRYIGCMEEIDASALKINIFSGKIHRVLQVHPAMLQTFISFK